MGAAKFTFGSIALLLGLGLFVAVGWHFFRAEIPGVTTWMAIGVVGIGLWLANAGIGFLKEAFAPEPPSAAEASAAAQVLEQGRLAAAIEEAVEEAAAHLGQLAQRGADLDRAGTVELLFAAPDAERARDLASRLQADLGGQARVGAINDDDEFPVVLTVKSSAREAGMQEQVEHRVRTAHRAPLRRALRRVAGALTAVAL
ncbi:MAG: hypothetical protein WBO45_09235 [Planctomycetota bacterium]